MNHKKPKAWLKRDITIWAGFEDGIDISVMKRFTYGRRGGISRREYKRVTASSALRVYRLAGDQGYIFKKTAISEGRFLRLYRGNAAINILGNQGTQRWLTL